ncbi:MAG: hypothetical protein JNM19_16555 [Chitinophagaceae bacterium]|nr:hypothetical protein [Chitinophagaceae bacterium]
MVLFKFIYSITIRKGKKPDGLSSGLEEVFIVEGLTPGSIRADIKKAITSNAAVMMYKILILFTCISLGTDKRSRLHFVSLLYVKGYLIKKIRCTVNQML